MDKRTKAQLLQENAELKKEINHLKDIIYHDPLIIESSKDKFKDKLKSVVQKKTALLRESDDILRAFTENARDVIMRFDKQLRHTYVNSIIQEQTGIPPEDFIGKTHEDMGCFPPHLVTLWEKALQIAFESGKPERIEFELPNNIWIDWLLVPEYSRDGIIRSVIATARDITVIKRSQEEITKLNAELEKRVAERTSELEKINKELHDKIIEQKKTEAILAQEEKRYRTLFDLSPSGIMVMDTEGNILEANKASSESNGYSQEELIGKNIRMIAHPDSVKEIENNIKSILSGTNLKHTVKNLKKDGSKCYIELNETKYPLENGKDGILVITSDITAKVKAEKKLRASEERLRTLINAMPDIVCFKDGEGRWLEANEADLSLFRLKNADYIGKKDSDLAHYSPFFKEAFMQCEDSDEQAWRMKVLSRVEETIPTPDGINHLFEITKIPIFYRNGDRKGLVVLGRDITEQKEAERNLIQAKEEAEKSNKLKTEFLAQMSHEIRSPINIILSFTSLLKEELKGKIPAELDMSFDSIDNGGKRIIRTIDQILNMSQLHIGSFETNFVEVDLVKNVLEDCIKEFRTAARMKGLNFEFKNNAGNTRIIADHYSVMQIFSNLLDNSIKYTKQGGITVELYENQDKHVCVDVKDTGIGISHEYLPDLFRPFSQEESGYTRRYEGNGLGLALVKSYVELNGAEIAVESSKGSGSTFRVKFNNYKAH